MLLWTCAVKLMGSPSSTSAPAAAGSTSAIQLGHIASSCQVAIRIATRIRAHIFKHLQAHVPACFSAAGLMKVKLCYKGFTVSDIAIGPFEPSASVWAPAGLGKSKVHLRLCSIAVRVTALCKHVLSLQLHKDGLHQLA